MEVVIEQNKEVCLVQGKWRQYVEQLKTQASDFEDERVRLSDLHRMERALSFQLSEEQLGAYCSH